MQIHLKMKQIKMYNRATSEVFGVKRRTSRSGATLVEALLALALFAGFTMGAAKLMVMNRKLLDMARSRYTAANLAKNRMELVRTFEFEQILELNERTLVVDAKGIPSEDGYYRRVTSVTPLATNLCELAITVEVKNRKTLAFDTEGETVTTYVAKHL